MRKVIFSFVGKKKDFEKQLAAAVAREQGRDNVIYLQHCELCGGLAKGDICRKCEPLFKRVQIPLWTIVTPGSPYGFPEDELGAGE